MKGGLCQGEAAFGEAALGKRLCLAARWRFNFSALPSLLPRAALLEVG